MKRGKLIVFEGISGTGKETQAKLLQQYLKKKHVSSVIVFHPTTGIKPILRQQKTVTDQLHILAADRAGVVNQVIRPSLKQGKWVISLRSYVSAYVYQVNGSSVRNVDVTPDWLFYFDIAPEEAMKRITKRGETLGRYETISLLREKRKKYKEVLKTIPHSTLDASLDVQSIHNTIISSITVLT
jgi:dTMP kinase